MGFIVYMMRKLLDIASYKNILYTMNYQGKIEPKKTIFQVRYKPMLQFYELLIPTAQKFTDYPHWNTNKLKISLFDYEKHCSLNIKFDSFTYEQDANEQHLEQKNISDAVKILPSSFDITNYSFFGYRKQYLIPTDMSYESIVHVLNIKFFSQNDKLKKIIPKTIADLTYKIDCVEGKYKYHFTIGPIRKNEIPRYIQPNQELHFKPLDFQNDYLEKYPEIAILIDIDIYQNSEKYELQDLNSFISFAQEKSINLAGDISKYIFSVEK